jgi:virginiamycin B lyase
MRLPLRSVAASCAAFLLLALADPVPAASAVAPYTTSSLGPTGVVTHFSDPTISGPESIAVGSDGALWFTNFSSIGRITTSGSVSHFSDPGIASPSSIVAGPDGAMWFTNSDSWFASSRGNRIGRITTDGVVTDFSDPSIADPSGITVGPDGALWFANFANSSIGRITTTGVVSHFTDPSIDGPGAVVSGPDGALWFTNDTDDVNNTVRGSIGRISTTGAVSNFTDPTIRDPKGIAVGPDGNLWFTNRGGGSVGNITMTGVVRNVADPSIAAPSGIAEGSDSALWFTNGANPGSIGRVTTGGRVRYFTDPSVGGPSAIVSGPDGALWFTNSVSQSIGRITPLTGPTEVVTAGATDEETAIEVSRLSFPATASASAVVLARDDMFADALGGARLATASHGPLLLTPSTLIDADTEVEIKRILPPGADVYILGGSSAIDPSVDRRLEADGLVIVREAGTNRFDTAAHIASDVVSLDEQAGTSAPTPLNGPILVATGQNFPDGLTAGAAASEVGGVVLLSDGRQPNPSTTAYIQAHPAARLYAIGGQASAAYPSATPLVGATRYDTATVVAEQLFKAPTVVAVASGVSFAAALTGDAAIGRLGGPLLLTAPDTLPASTVQYLTANQSTINTDYIFGGDYAVSPSVRHQIAAAQASV